MSERALPSEIGGYTVVGQLGVGSYGAVFRVRRTGLLRDLALKVLPSDLNPEDLQRFRREARVVARLDHPFVVRGFEFGRDAATGWHYLCLDLVEGPSLKQHLQRVGPLPWARAAELVADVARAVDYAHQQGVIHRDLKPANVLLDRHGFVRVTDFGLARDLGELTLTAPGEVLGTPYYMAPEQVRGEKGTPQFDVHALGVMLFELVTGERPYPGESIAEVVGLILEGQPPRPSERAAQALPPGFDAICQRAMAADPAQRFASARALADALQELERSHGGAHLPPQGRRTPESVGLPAAAPSQAPAGALLGAGVAAAMLLPLLSLALVWGWARGGSRRLAAPAPAAPEPVRATREPDVPQRLAETLQAIEAWDLPRAEPELRALELLAPQAHAREVASLRSLYAAALKAEAAEVERLRTSYLEGLRGCVALDEALVLLDAHPDSAPLGCETARLLAVCGELARAHATLEHALRQDPALGDRAEVKTLRSALQKNAGREPARTLPALWRHWRPYQGGLWREDTEGRVHGSGYGLGDYDLAGLLEVRERRLSAPYRLDVEVSLGAGKRAYGGVLFGVDRVGSGYLAYLVREEQGLAKFASDAERARVEASGRPPLFLRVARLVEGNWSMVGTWLCAAADPGAEPISLRVAVLPEGLQATVGGVAERLVRLPSAVADGEVGVLSFFGGPVAYRGFRSDLE